jgi:hypothetical protein
MAEGAADVNKVVSSGQRKTIAAAPKLQHIPQPVVMS